MKSFNFVFFIAAMALIATSAQASVTITSNTVEAFATDTIGAGTDTFSSFIAIPTSTTVDAIDGTAYSKNPVNWSVSGSQTILKFDINQQRPGAGFSHVNTANQVDPLTFIPATNQQYQLSGYFNVTDVGTGSYVNLNVSLYDQTLSSYSFSNTQTSGATTNEQFILGGTGGDSSNDLSGSLAGNLIAGHSYQLNFEYVIANTNFSADLGATALGNLTLTISVPEPSTVGLFAMAGIFATLLRRKRTRS